MFQVDAQVAGGEAMCPMCQGVVAIPAEVLPPPDPFQPPFQPSYGPPEELFPRRSFPDPFAPSHDPYAPQAPLEQPLSAFACPHCGNPFQTDPTLAGQQVQCPTCAGLVVVPGDVPAVHAPPEIWPPAPPPEQFNFPAQAPTPRPVAPPSQAAPPHPAPPQPAPPQPSAPQPSPWQPAVQSAPLLPPSFSEPASIAPLSPVVPLSTADKAPSVPLSALAKSEPATKPKKSERALKSDPEPSAPKPTESQPSLSQPLTLQPLTPQPSSPTSSSPTSSIPKPAESKKKRIEALLPEEADPAEEVMAERPIAAVEPPADDGDESKFALRDEPPEEYDEYGEPIVRPDDLERDRRRRIRSVLFFVAGVAVLLMAVLLLGKTDMFIDFTPPPKK